MPKPQKRKIHVLVTWITLFLTICSLLAVYRSSRTSNITSIFRAVTTTPHRQRFYITLNTLAPSRSSSVCAHREYENEIFKIQGVTYKTSACAFANGDKDDSDRDNQKEITEEVKQDRDDQSLAKEEVKQKQEPEVHHRTEHYYYDPREPLGRGFGTWAPTRRQKATRVAGYRTSLCNLTNGESNDNSSDESKDESRDETKDEPRDESKEQDQTQTDEEENKKKKEEIHSNIPTYDPLFKNPIRPPETHYVRWPARKKPKKKIGPPDPDD